MRIRLYQTLEKLFSILAETFENLRQKFAVCPDCGENMYTGKPCVKF